MVEVLAGMLLKLIAAAYNRIAAELLNRSLARSATLAALSATALMMVFVISPAFAFFALSMIRCWLGMLGINASNVCRQQRRREGVFPWLHIALCRFLQLGDMAYKLSNQ